MTCNNSSRYETFLKRLKFVVPSRISYRFRFCFVVVFFSKSEGTETGEIVNDTRTRRPNMNNGGYTGQM